MSTHPTICKECEHFHNVGPRSVRAEFWRSHLCLASPLPSALNFVTGERETEPSKLFAYCRAINTGKCRKFSAVAPDMKKPRAEAPG